MELIPRRTPEPALPVSAVASPTISPTLYPLPSFTTVAAVIADSPAETVTFKVNPEPSPVILKVLTGFVGVPYPLPPVKIPTVPSTGPPLSSTNALR